jgi:hypothetical protein
MKSVFVRVIRNIKNVVGKNLINDKGVIMLESNRWRTKYQAKNLKDGELLNLRDMHVYKVSKDGFKKLRSYK